MCGHRVIAVGNCHPHSAAVRAFVARFTCGGARWPDLLVWRTTANWAGRSGRAHKLRGARVTASHAYQVGAVVCVHARDMKEPWCLAASDAETPAGTLIKQYARRWTIEPSFRDTKDLRFGMGMAEIHIADPERRDRLLLISAFATALLTMLGTAGESLGMDLCSNPHIKDAYTLAVPPRLHALRTDPEHARASAPAADAAVRGNAAQQRAVWRVSVGDEIRGRVRVPGVPPTYRCLVRMVRMVRMKWRAPGMDARAGSGRYMSYMLFIRIYTYMV
jgi:hypothetical protein